MIALSKRDRINTGSAGALARSEREARKTRHT